MISTMETKSCKNCSHPFEITDQDLAFYKRVEVPPPKTCPDCRLVRRLQERNAKTLYSRKCDATGEDIISMYHKDHIFPVYKSDYWWSDKWDAMDYGKDFDFNRPFFEQFEELANKVPHFGTFIINGTMQNSDYTNCTGYLKNCYLIGEADYDESCYYSNRIDKCTNVMDSSVIYESELCYECIDCRTCYNLKFSQDCETCRDSFFLYNCKSCQNCIACANQRHKSYMIFNKQYSKEKYEQMVINLDFTTIKNIEHFKEQFKKFLKTQPRKNLQQERNENSFGDHLYNSKNATYCFDSIDLEDCKYCLKLNQKIKDCMDFNSWGMNTELMYQCATCGDHVYNMKFCSTCTTDLHDCEYCIHCSACNNIFGCFGLKRKEYCVFNKQYPKEEYIKLVARIKDHMMKTGEYGEYFPLSFCPFGYNESIAMDDFAALTKEEALKKGYKWVEKDRTYLPQTYKVQERIGDVSDGILNEILTCKSCKKNYKIVEPELKFYRDQNLPIPEFCSECRHIRRVRQRNPKRFRDIKCAKCGKDCKTTFKAEDNLIIYCEDCYNKLVI